MYEEQNPESRRALFSDPHLHPLPHRERRQELWIEYETTSCRFLCHSERSEESRIFLGANHCTLNHGSDRCVGRRNFSASPLGRGRRAQRAPGEGASLQLDASIATAPASIQLDACALTRRSRTHVDLSRGERYIQRASFARDSRFRLCSHRFAEPTQSSPFGDELIQPHRAATR